MRKNLTMKLLPPLLSVIFTAHTVNVVPVRVLVKRYEACPRIDFCNDLPNFYPSL